MSLNEEKVTIPTHDSNKHLRICSIFYFKNIMNLTFDTELLKMGISLQDL